MELFKELYLNPTGQPVPAERESPSYEDAKAILGIFMNILRINISESVVESRLQQQPAARTGSGRLNDLFLNRAMILPATDKTAQEVSTIIGEKLKATPDKYLFCALLLQLQLPIESVILNLCQLERDVAFKTVSEKNLYLATTDESVGVLNKLDWRTSSQMSYFYGELVSKLPVSLSSSALQFVGAFMDGLEECARRGSKQINADKQRYEQLLLVPKLDDARARLRTVMDACFMQLLARLELTTTSYAYKPLAATVLRVASPFWLKQFEQHLQLGQESLDTRLDYVREPNLLANKDLEWHITDGTQFNVVSFNFSHLNEFEQIQLWPALKDAAPSIGSLAQTAGKRLNSVKQAVLFVKNELSRQDRDRIREFFVMKSDARFTNKRRLEERRWKEFDSIAGAINQCYDEHIKAILAFEEKQCSSDTQVGVLLLVDTFKPAINNCMDSVRGRVSSEPIFCEALLQSIYGREIQPTLCRDKLDNMHLPNVILNRQSEMVRQIKRDLHRTQDNYVNARTRAIWSRALDDEPPQERVRIKQQVSGTVNNSVNRCLRFVREQLKLDASRYETLIIASDDLYGRLRQVTLHYCGPVFRKLVDKLSEMDQLLACSVLSKISAWTRAGSSSVCQKRENGQEVIRAS